MIYINLFFASSIIFLLLTYEIIKVECTNKLYKKDIAEIEKVKSTILPTILNEQMYYYHKVRYKNYVFFQLLRSKDYISNEIKARGKWPECEEMYDLYMSGNRKGIFIDFGANIGSCSFLFAQAGIETYSFEPIPNNLFPLTVTTFGNANFTKYITIYPYALGKEEKKKVMKISKRNWSASSLFYNFSDYKQIVYQKKLDDFDKLIPKNVTLIKIDVEGAEYDLINGGKKFFKNHKAEYIHMEAVCGEKGINGEFEVEGLYRILNNMGYKVIKRIDCMKYHKHNIIAQEI